MGARKKANSLKKSSSKEFSKLLNQSAAAATAKSTPRRSESAFTSKFLFLTGLWILRLLVVFFPQYGYIQPDEFFQFTEPIAGDVLGLENLRVWEFNQTAPLRSMFFPALFSLPVFQCLKNLYAIGDSVNVSAYLLLVGPRLLITLASFLIDFAVYRLCRLLYSPGPSCKSPLSAKTIDCLLVHASSYLAFTYYTHTFSNTIETILYGLLLVVIIESLRQPPSAVSSLAAYCKISILLSFGFFNRPTFAAFAFVPTMYWLTTYSTSSPSKAFAKSTRLSWGSWFVSCARNALANGFNMTTPFTLSSTLLILVDTGYHRGLENLSSAISEISITKLIEHLAVTPINFLNYNLQTENLANHGLHPIWFHALVCMPWSFTLLAVIFYLDLVSKLKSQLSLKPRFTITNPTAAVLYLSIVFSLICFSSRPHQEPRFLLPLIIPMVCLFGYRLFSYRGALSFLWCGINIFLVIFYGHVHQAGVVSSLSHLQSTVIRPSSEASPPTVLIFARQYLPPRHLLTIPKRQMDRFTIHDLATLDFPSTFEEHLATVSPSSQIYLTIPSCLTRQLQHSLATKFPSVSLSLQHRHFPHFSAEDLKDSVRTFTEDHDDSALTVWSAWHRLHESFSMNIWKLTFGQPASEASTTTADSD